MKSRTIAHILKAEKLNMGGFVVKQPLPTMRVDQIDPFLLLHHFGPIRSEPGTDPMDLGSAPAPRI